MAAAFERTAGARGVHKDAAHDLRRQRKKLRALAQFHVGHVHQPQIDFMDQCGGLEGVVSRISALHVPASHEAQFRIYALRQRAQGRFVTAAPGFQENRDFRRGVADGQPVFPQAREIYQNVAAFADGFRLYQRKEIMISHIALWKTALTAALCAAALSQTGRAQVPPASVLRIDTINAVNYDEDTGDVFKFATDPGTPTHTPVHLNFNGLIAIADIQAVNGQPAMGVLTRVGPNIHLTAAPLPSDAIADVTRNGAQVVSFEILKSDGTPIGTIVASGFGGGAAPPGAPLEMRVSNFAVTGGTGAFLGARGQVGAENNVQGGAGPRLASISEDPANRRRNGGGTQRWVIHLIPMESPEIAMLPAGPAISHSSDFSLVSASKPAAAGEILSLFAKGLGPVNPGVDPGQPFPSSPPAAVNSPVEVLVNGKAAEVLSAVGYPGAVDGYQVNFRVPPDAAKGVATIQVSAAWMAGNVVRMAIQ